MAKDVNLAILTAATAYAATGAVGAAKDTEGGFYAFVRLVAGAMTGTTPTCDLDIQVRVDGTNWRGIGKFPQLVGTDDNIEIARVVYIPKPTAPQTVSTVRLYATIAGTTPSFTFNRVDIEPMVSLGAPAVDEGLSVGIAKLASV